MRGLIGLFLILVCVAFIWGGAQGVYVGLTNTAPHELSCKQFAASHSGKTWLRLTGCRLDPERAVSVRTERGTVKGYYAPLIPKDAATGGTVHVLVQADSEKGLVALAFEKDYEGMALFGIEEDDRVREAFDKATLKLARNYVILDPAARPALGTNAIMLFAGLLLGTFMLRRLKPSGANVEQARVEHADRTTAPIP
jgi:hypothetical protein